MKSGYQRRIHHLLNRGETRNSLARDVFHGHRGQLRKHYQVGQENQLDTLGIMHATDMTRWALPEAGGDLHGQLPRADGPRERDKLGEVTRPAPVGRARG